MARIGWAKCPIQTCGNTEASLSRNDHGTVTLRCHRCEFSGYAKAGTKAARDLLAGMKPDAEGGAPAAAAAPGATAEPAPAKPARAPRQPFNLSQLGG